MYDSFICGTQEHFVKNASRSMKNILCYTQERNAYRFRITWGWV